jgi:hypothetical protein
MKIFGAEVLRLTVDHACFAVIVGIAASKNILMYALPTLAQPRLAVLVKIRATQEVAAGSAD